MSSRSRLKLARSREQCPLPRYWVPKAKRMCVQEAPICQLERLLGAVEVVAEDGVTYRIHVKSLSMPIRQEKGRTIWCGCSEVSRPVSQARISSECSLSLLFRWSPRELVW